MNVGSGIPCRNGILMLSFKISIISTLIRSCSIAMSPVDKLTQQRIEDVVAEHGCNQFMCNNANLSRSSSGNMDLQVKTISTFDKHYLQLLTTVNQ